MNTEKQSYVVNTVDIYSNVRFLEKYNIQIWFLFEFHHPSWASPSVALSSNQIPKIQPSTKLFGLLGYFHHHFQVQKFHEEKQLEAFPHTLIRNAKMYKTTVPVLDIFMKKLELHQRS